MEAVEQFIKKPGDEDVRLDEVFTDAMLKQVMTKLKEAGVGELESAESLWNSHYRSRRVVSTFLKDAEIGKKRLISMPDRITNTLQLPSGELMFRPTVINCYSEPLGTPSAWFDSWLAFFFDTPTDLDGKGRRPIHTYLQRIRRSKYPAVTANEETASIPLQLLLLGAFDAALVRLLQAKAGSDWQTLRREICKSMQSEKTPRIVEVLESTYSNADIIFLQEVGNQLLERLKAVMGEKYSVIAPRTFSTGRGQNSVMLLRSELFSPDYSEVDVAAAGWEAGDLLAVRTQVAGGASLMLASFHGDTNGLLTEPAVDAVVQQLHPAEPLLFGLDANAHKLQSKSTAYVLDFQKAYRRLGLQACWDSETAAAPPLTTFNARTFLQPQLNKAVGKAELLEKGDRNPKDYVLFSKGNFALGSAWRDNTGRGEFLEDTVFPTLEFPSDHAVVAADLVLIAPTTNAKSEL